MHPYLLPHLMGGCVKHRVKRSLALSAARSMFLSKTFGIAGSRRKGTLSLWYKRGKLDASSAYLSVFDAGDGTANNNDQVYFQADNLVLNFYRNGNIGKLVTSALFRDPVAHGHLVLNWDTTQATASERAKIFRGAARVSSFSTETYPPQNFDTYFGAAVLHRIGQLSYGGQFFDGYLSDIHFIDGAALGPESFGRIDPRSGEWAPIAFNGDHGANGFYLPFLGDAGDAPATAAEGAKDRASLLGGHVAANDWTANNIVAADYVKDSPTNYRSGSDYRGNYATWSPIDIANSAVISRANLRADQGGSNTTISSGRSTHWMRSGKYYWEVYTSAAGLAGVGNGYAAIGVARPGPLSAGGTLVANANEYMVRDNGNRRNGGVDGAASMPAWLSTNLCFCYDADTGKLWFGAMGVFAGDPAAGTGWDYIVPAPAAAAFNLYRSGSSYITADLNCGQLPFLYAPPAGFKPLVTSAIPRPKRAKPIDAFVDAEGSGAAIVATLAAKRASWGTAYVDIYKRCDANEGWRFRFGDDDGFYLDTSDVAAGKQAFPVLAGSDYAAVSLRVGAEYGVITGTVVHATGAATPVLDNLNTMRKAIILRRVDAGGAMPMRHPDGTAGKLLYMNSTAEEVTASDITAITTNGFSVGVGMPSGTYRYLVMAEEVGAISFTRSTGNSSADGPLDFHGGAIGLNIRKLLIAGTGSWHTRFGIRNPTNPAQRVVMLESNILERTSDGSGAFNVDLLATGTKQRNTRTDNNGASTYVEISIISRVFATGECAAQGTAR